MIDVNKFEALKIFKLTEVKNVHSANIYPIFVRDDEFNLSSKDVKDLQ